MKNNRQKAKETIIKSGHKLTAYDIAKMYGLPAMTIHYYAWKMGVKLRPADKGKMKPLNPGKYFRVNEMDNWLIY